MWLKFIPNGLTQKWSGSSGSRAVMWPGDALVEAEPAEQPERRGEPLLAVLALLLDRLVLRAGTRRPAACSWRPSGCCRSRRILLDRSARVVVPRDDKNASSPGASRMSPVSRTTRPVTPWRVSRSIPASGPATNAALARAWAHHASPDTTVTAAMPVRAGAPVAGSTSRSAVGGLPAGAVRRAGGHRATHGGGGARAIPGRKRVLDVDRATPRVAAARRRPGRRTRC